MTLDRVVIAGMGAVSRIGIGIPDHLASLRPGRGVLNPIEAFADTDDALAGMPLRRSGRGRR
jgi:hypothetical protein